MYIDKAIQYYLDELASKSPTPGGGGVAALVGALACGLVSMTANFTLGKEEYKKYEKEVAHILVDNEKLRKNFTQLVDEDSFSYQKVAAAYKLPKVTSEEKEKRSLTIQSALKRSTLVVLNICKNSFSGLNLASDLVEVANVNLLDDLSASLILFEASFKLAMFNVRSNLNKIKEDKFIKETEQSIREPEQKITALKEKLLQQIDKRIKNAC